MEGLFSANQHLFVNAFMILSTFKISITYLSASIAEPSSNNSSTTPTAESFFVALFVEFRDFFPNINEVRKFCFFLGVGGKTG